MEIAVVGTCQAHPLTLCLMALAPDLVAKPIIVNSTTEITEDLAAYDLVFATLLNDGHLEEVCPKLAGRVFEYPRVTYTAFTPDIVYATKDVAKMKSPAGDYHSSLILYAWLHDLSARETKALFCQEVYERLNFSAHLGVSRALMRREGEEINFPMESLLDKWHTRGRFMHSVNHPSLFVMADIARVLAERSGIDTQTTRPEDYVVDPLMYSCVWPVYPGLNPLWENFASYDFKAPQDLIRSADQPVRVFSLDAFIEASLEAYAPIGRGPICCPQIENLAYQGLDEWARKEASRVSPQTKTKTKTSRRHPYLGLPHKQFWRKAIGDCPVDAIDPVDDPLCSITPGTKIATIGSCFAQHIAVSLQKSGLTYFVAETPPPSLPAQEAIRRQYGLFSARYGNIYTARQLLQLYDRAYGLLNPADGAWKRPDGRYIDPFRPSIEPDGFLTPEEVEQAREAHLESVRALFTELDVLIITLGLTEAWRARADGVVVPLAPGVAGDPREPNGYEFVNFSVDDVRRDLHEFRAKLKQVNPRASIILTVSPVPLVATFECRHVLTATTYSKSVLRVAADELHRTYDDVTYFPSYEIITGNYGGASHFEGDMRTVRQSSVDRVMSLFMSHYVDKIDLKAGIQSIHQILCDEEQLAVDDDAREPGRASHSDVVRATP